MNVAFLGVSVEHLRVQLDSPLQREVVGRQTNSQTWIREERYKELFNCYRTEFNNILHFDISFDQSSTSNLELFSTLFQHMLFTATFSVSLLKILSNFHGL